MSFRARLGETQTAFLRRVDSGLSQSQWSRWVRVGVAPSRVWRLRLEEKLRKIEKSA